MVKQKRILSNAEQVAEKFTKSIGSLWSIILHTVLFVAAFVIVLFGYSLDRVLLVLTTIVSLEAIYLALFIQMTVNRNTESLAEVEEDIDEIAEDVEGIEKDIDEIEKDIDEIQEDVEEIEKDDQDDDLHDVATMKTLTQLQKDIMKVMEDLQALKDQKKE